MKIKRYELRPIDEIEAAHAEQAKQAQRDHSAGGFARLRSYPKAGSTNVRKQTIPDPREFVETVKRGDPFYDELGNECIIKSIDEDSIRLTLLGPVQWRAFWGPAPKERDIVVHMVKKVDVVGDYVRIPVGDSEDVKYLKRRFGIDPENVVLNRQSRCYLIYRSEDNWYLFETNGNKISSSFFLSSGTGYCGGRGYTIVDGMEDGRIAWDSHERLPDVPDASGSAAWKGVSAPMAGPSVSFTLKGITGGSLRSGGKPFSPTGRLEADELGISVGVPGRRRPTVKIDHDLTSPGAAERLKAALEAKGIPTSILNTADIERALADSLSGTLSEAVERVKHKLGVKGE